jgi:hypothetical protein
MWTLPSRIGLTPPATNSACFNAGGWEAEPPPNTSVRVVSTGGLDRVLPVMGPRVDCAERAAAVRKRQIGVQQRSQW